MYVLEIHILGKFLHMFDRWQKDVTESGLHILARSTNMISIEEIREWLEEYKFGKYLDVQTFLKWVYAHAKTDLKDKLNYKDDYLDKARTKAKLHEALKGG